MTTNAVPPPGTNYVDQDGYVHHVFAQGDTALSEIAEYGLSMKDFMELNTDSDADRLHRLVKGPDADRISASYVQVGQDLIVGVVGDEFDDDPNPNNPTHKAPRVEHVVAGQDGVGKTALQIADGDKEEARRIVAANYKAFIRIAPKPPADPSGEPAERPSLDQLAKLWVPGLKLRMPRDEPSDASTSSGTSASEIPEPTDTDVRGAESGAGPTSARDADVTNKPAEEAQNEASAAQQPESPSSTEAVPTSAPTEQFRSRGTVPPVESPLRFPGAHSLNNPLRTSSLNRPSVTQAVAKQHEDKPPPTEHAPTTLNRPSTRPPTKSTLNRP